MTDVMFIHLRGFDNRRSQRPWTVDGIHAWPLRTADVASFCATYADRQPERIVPRIGARITAYDYDVVDRYVMKQWHDLPQPVLFDPAQHCLTSDIVYQRCWCGSSDCPGQHVQVWNNPFQVVITGPIVRVSHTAIADWRPRTDWRRQWDRAYCWR